MAFAAAWWRVGLGIGGGLAVAVFLWRWALEDLVLSSVEIPTCERSAPASGAVGEPNASLTR